MSNSPLNNNSNNLLNKTTTNNNNYSPKHHQSSLNNPNCNLQLFNGFLNFNLI